MGDNIEDKCGGQKCPPTPTELPDKMTGKDLVVQENYEHGMDKQLFDSMDKVDRRDKRNHIMSMSSTSYVEHFGGIDWNRR
jgi:hypothetical protein